VHEAYPLNPLFFTLEASMEDKEVMAEFDLIYLSPGLHLLSNMGVYFLFLHYILKYFVYI